MNTIPEVTSQTYRVPDENLPELERKLQKLVKKSAKLSAGSVSYTVDRENPENRGYVRNTDRSSLKKYREALPGETPEFFQRWFQVTVSGTVPRLAGWTFIATLDHMDVEGEVANILRVVPGFEENLPVQYRTASPENCDHCHKAIRTRKNTFIVRNEAGEFKQVGRNCTQEFLGGVNPHDVAKLMEYLQLAFGAAGSEFGGFGGRGEMGYSISSFLSVVSAVVRKFGWLSRGEARRMDRIEDSTADTALYILNPPKPGTEAYSDWEKDVEALNEGPEDGEEAEKVIDFIRDTIDFRVEENDYRYNLRVAFGQEVVYRNLVGIVASGVMFYQREQQKLKEREGLRKQTSNEFVGEVGKEVQIRNAQLVFRKQPRGKCFQKFITEDGRCITGYGHSEAKVGDIGTVWAKVKEQKNDPKYGASTFVWAPRSEVFITAERQTELDVLEAEQKAAKKAAAAAKRAEKKALAAATNGVQ